METIKNRFPLVLKSTAAASGAAAVLLALVYHFRPLDWVLSTAITAFTISYHFVMRLIVGWIVPKLIPASVPGRPWFRQKAFEHRLYALLRVKSWKDRMPTYDPMSFSLKHNSLEQIVFSSCVSEAVHEVIILFSFVPLLFSIPWGVFPVFLITSVAAALFDSAFVIMQRYNRPRLVRILEKRRPRAHE